MGFLHCSSSSLYWPIDGRVGRFLNGMNKNDWNDLLWATVTLLAVVAIALVIGELIRESR